MCVIIELIPPNGHACSEQLLAANENVDQYKSEENL